MIEPIIQWELSLTAEVGQTWWSNITCSMGYADQLTEGVLIELQRNNYTVAFCKLFTKEQAHGDEFLVQRVPSGCTFSGAEALGRYQCILSIFNHGNEYLILQSDTIDVTTLSSSNIATIIVPVVSSFVAILALVIVIAVCMKKYWKQRSISYRFREPTTINNCRQRKSMEAFNEIICEYSTNYWCPFLKCIPCVCVLCILLS